MIKRSEYKDKPTLQLMKDENDRFPFSFGIAKARMILENLDAIRSFVAEQEVTKNGPEKFGQ